MTKIVKPISKIKELIDTLGLVNVEYKRLADEKKDLEILVKTYIEEKNFEAEEDALLIGSQFQIKLGAVGIKRTITDMPTVRKLLGETAFMGLATIKLSDLDKYLSTEEQHKVIKSERIGTRVMKFEEAPAQSNLKTKTKQTKTNKNKQKQTKTKQKQEETEFEF